MEPRGKKNQDKKESGRKKALSTWFDNTFKGKLLCRTMLTLICVNVYEIMREFLINVWKTCLREIQCVLS